LKLICTKVRNPNKSLKELNERGIGTNENLRILASALKERKFKNDEKIEVGPFVSTKNEVYENLEVQFLESEIIEDKLKRELKGKEYIQQRIESCSLKYKRSADVHACKQRYAIYL